MTLKKLLLSLSSELAPFSSTPELDAKVILKNILNKDDSFFFSRPESPISNSQYGKIRNLTRKRKEGWPIAYLVGHKEFYGYDFIVNKNVLIPRPESEWLVEEAIQFIKLKVLKVHKELNILDLGTGSGCLVISLAKELYKLDKLSSFINLFASDISNKALLVAKKNAKRLIDEPTKIKFIHSDLFTNRLLHKRFDLIIANLPYVPKPDCHFDRSASERRVEKSLGKLETNSFEISRQARDDKAVAFEPQNAIFADNNGTAIIKRFLKEARGHLSGGGILLIELDPRNAATLFEFAKKNYPESKIDLQKDHANHNRYLKISTSS